MTGFALNRRKDEGGPEYYPTPPWATRALCEYLKPVVPLKKLTAWEPACGEGYMVRPLKEYFKYVIATDLIDRRASWAGQDGVDDFLLDWPNKRRCPADFIITNPPFNLATEFIDLALKRARIGVALLLKQQILEGVNRHRDIFNARPPQLMLQFSERVPVRKGCVVSDTKTNQAYMWLVWLKDKDLRAATHSDSPHPSFRWIPPKTRKRLERPEDYSFKAAAAPKPAALPLLDGLGTET